MRIKFRKLALGFAIIFLVGIVQSCLEKNDVNPQPAQPGAVEVTVLDEIKNLGFDAADIQDKGSYYLVEGDIYFSKNKASVRKLPVMEKPKTNPGQMQRRPAITVGLDRWVAANTVWKSGIDQAIARWNANEDNHFSFEIVNTENADIYIQTDNDELSEDVEIASEFAAHGFVGSRIRVNLDYAKAATDQSKTKTFEGLSHAVGLKHDDLLAKDDATMPAAVVARTQYDPNDFVFVIFGDNLFGVHRTTGNLSFVSNAWAGSTLISSSNGNLYVVQFDALYVAYPTGGWDYLSNGWSGSQTLTRAFESRDLYVMQGDYLWGVNYLDGSWWQVISSSATTTPWSQTRFVSSSAYGNTYGLAVIDRTSLIGNFGYQPSYSFVCTDPADPTFGKKKLISRNATWSGVKGLATYHDMFSTYDRKSFVVNNGPFQVYTPGTGNFESLSYYSSTTIDWSKTQSIASGRFQDVYFLIDGGLYYYNYRNGASFELFAIKKKGSFPSTTIMTPFL